MFVSWKLITNVSMEVSLFSPGKIGAVLSMKPGGAARCPYATGGLAALRGRYKWSV